MQRGIAHSSDRSSNNTVVTDDGAAAAIYPRRLEDWENQPSESTRTEFLDRLAWWQWSANESRSMWNWLLAQLG